MGYPAENPGLFSRSVKWITGSATRKPLTSFVLNMDCTSADISNQHPWYKPLESVRWAPSAVNRQPIRVLLQPSSEAPTTFHFYTQNVHSMYQDAGIAMWHFEVVANEEYRRGTWSRNAAAAPKVTDSNLVYIATWTTQA